MPANAVQTSQITSLDSPMFAPVKPPIYDSLGFRPFARHSASTPGLLPRSVCQLGKPRAQIVVW